MQLIFLCACVFFMPFFAAAATLTFEPQDSSAGIGEPFVVALNVTADEGVNAFEVVLNVPRALTPTDVSDGNSIITLWAEEPVFDEASRTLSFAGVVPHGFSGTDGRLITVTFTPTIAESVTLSVNRKTGLYAGEGGSVSYTSAPLVLPVLEGKSNLVVELPDTNSPEAFEPSVVEDPLLFDGKRVLVFSTTDKGSGIAGYEVQESWFRETSDDAWRAAESPYVLRDQRRSSYVFVRATDKAGNAYVAVIPPVTFPMIVYIVPAFILLIMVFFLYVRRFRAR